MFRSTYESKYRAAEKADSEYERVKFSTKPREVDKAKKNQQQSRLAADKADEDYKGTVDQLENYRQSWVGTDTGITSGVHFLKLSHLRFLAPCIT